MINPNMDYGKQLTVEVEDGQLKISIGIALLAFATQTALDFPPDFKINDLRDFAKSMVGQLQRQEEDGTTPIHRMFDAAANEIMEQGDDGIEEGDVDDGISMAAQYLSDKNLNDLKG